MAEYPTKLRNFKAWAKAMEEGATVDKPSYKSQTHGKKASRGTRRLRRTLPRRKRQKRKGD